MTHYCHWCGADLDGTDGKIWCNKTHKRKGVQRRKSLLESPIRPCPHPEKLVIFNRGQAVRKAQENGADWYQCRCGALHLTSRKRVSA